MATKYTQWNSCQKALTYATVMTSLGLVACSTTTHQQPTESPANVSTSRPIDAGIKDENPACSENFKIAQKIDNGVIVSHQIIGHNDARGMIRYSGKYSHVGDKAYSVFRADACPNNFWVADVDPKANLLTAYSNKESSRSRLRAAPPPCSVGYKLEIAKGTSTNRIGNHTVVNAKPEWGVFQLVSIDKITTLATFDNWQYPGCKWRGVFPNRVGLWRADVMLVPQSCEEVTATCTK